MSSARIERREHGAFNMSEAKNDDRHAVERPRAMGCSAARLEENMHGKIIPIGSRFGALEVLSSPILRRTGQQRKNFYPCVCHNCGTVEDVVVDTLRRGSAKECKGCGLQRRKAVHRRIIA